MHSQAISETSFAFLDTETTGLSPARGDRVCEIAVLKTRGGAVIESFQSLINPQRPIDLGAQAIHGISDAMVAEWKRLGEKLL
ncbi:MAG: 3'-5' exonuclease, partial [Elusimicrobiota bacterium]